MNDILSVVWKYTDIFNEKTAWGFGEWCNSRNLHLTESGTQWSTTESFSTLTLCSKG
ncbi:hypothetical protein V8B55DRAFT_1526741 [Mucor lusitanicus]